jgi:hypothetical protein
MRASLANPDRRFDVRPLSACGVTRHPILGLMSGELGRGDWSLPLLPAGFAIFESLPVGALVLDALAPAVGNGIITMADNGSEGVLVVRNGVVTERVWVANGVRSYGDEALALIRSADGAMVSARRLTDDAMALLGTLLHSLPCYTDLRLEWVSWPQLLGDLCARGQSFLVEVTTPSDRAIAWIRDGSQVATFADSHPTPGDVGLLNDLAAGGVGTIRVLVDDGAPEETRPEFAPITALSVDASPTVPVDERISEVRAPEIAVMPSRPRADPEPSQQGATAITYPMRAEHPEPMALQEAQFEAIVSVPARPKVVRDGGVSDSFTEIFGLPRDAPDTHRLTSLYPPSRGAEREVASVLPQLKLLVQTRLQRSSVSVEEIVESAAIDHHNVGWLSDRVRVMTMRGFLHSTFDQLADDMLELAGRDQG